MYHKAPLTRIRHSFSTEWNLNDTEVSKARNNFGINDIAESKRNLWIELMIDTFKDTMIWFLIGTSILFAILGNYNQTIILLLATIPLIGMDAFLHWRTTASTRVLSESLSSTAIVIRNNIEHKIPTVEIVPGDLVKIIPNSYFPADGLIVDGKNIQVDESALTGETFPAHKRKLAAFPDSTDEPSIQDIHWGFAGTRLLTGFVLLRVVFTGKETIYGEIVKSATETINERTPLQKSIGNLVFSLIIVATVICFILALVRYYQGFGIIDAILSAAVLAVAALPDEFPVVFTLFLGVGVYRLAIKKALVRRAVSVENIGRITCICSDKTGTITEGRFKMKQCLAADGFQENDLMQIALYASRIDSHDPLDIAIHNEANDLNRDKNDILPEVIFPFTEDRKRESAIIKLRNNDFLVATKGTPELIISLSKMETSKRNLWLNKANELASMGYKVIACGQCILHSNAENAVNIHIEPESNYSFVGLLVFLDPPRKEVFHAVQKCLKSGIHIIMITGDHLETARTIAKEIGLGNGNPRVILAEDLSSDLGNIDVIARAVPAQKLSIVKKLQASGEIVAVTGDGVNDVPALKAADVGIGMGQKGTQTTREISDIVLLDDNFNSIVNAITEGRQLFKNLKLSFQYLFMIHIPFVLSAALIPLLGFPLLYFPIHIVWVELLIHPTSMLVFQEKSEDNEKLDTVHKSKKISFFSLQDWIIILSVGMLSTGFIMLGYLFLLKMNYSSEYSRSFVLASLGLLNIALIASLTSIKTLIQKSIIVFTIIFTLVFIQIPVTANIFNLSLLSLKAWLILILFGYSVYFMVSILKKIRQ